MRAFCIDDILFFKQQPTMGSVEFDEAMVADEFRRKKQLEGVITQK